MKFNISNIDSFFDDRENGVPIFLKELGQALIELNTEEETSLFIQNIQSSLSRHRLDHNKSASCDRILFYLETSYGNYLDPKQPISNEGKKQLIDHCDKYILEDKSTVYASASEELLVIMQPLFNFEKTQRLTFGEATYLKQFWEHWPIDLRVDRLFQYDGHITDYLITYNFNPLNFHNFLINQIKNELQDEEDSFVLERLLLNHLKRFIAIPLRKGPYFPSTKKLVLEWLKSEVKLCRKKQNAANPLQTTLIPKKSYKIDLNLSVAQIAYFFKLLNSAGIIANKVQMEMFHVISENFRSKKSETISFDSLHNKYYNVTDSTEETIHALIQKMAKGL